MANQKKASGKSRPVNHRFVGMRDAVQTGGTGDSPGVSALAINTNAGGSTSGSFAFAPIGLTAAKLNTTTPQNFVNGAVGSVSKPLLRNLYYRAIDFQWYRVTRAKLVFVGAQGSNVTGIITLVGYTSPLDVAIGTGVPQLSGPNTRTFDLASAATKELSVPIPVDSAWKKVSALLSVTGSTAPFYGAGDSAINVSTVDDLCFGAVSYIVGSGPTGSGSGAYIGTLFVDYDVEFKGVIDPGVNQ